MWRGATPESVGDGLGDRDGGGDGNDGHAHESFGTGEARPAEGQQPHEEQRHDGDEDPAPALDDDARDHQSEDEEERDDAGEAGQRLEDGRARALEGFA